MIDNNNNQILLKLERINKLINSDINIDDNTINDMSSNINNSTSIYVSDDVNVNIKEYDIIESSRQAIKSGNTSLLDISLPGFAQTFSTPSNTSNDNVDFTIDNKNMSLNTNISYGATSLNKDIASINEIYDLFPYYNSIFEKVRTKLSKKMILPIGSTPKDLAFIIELNLGIQKLLKNSGFNGLHDLYTNIYMDQVRYGVSYVNFNRSTGRLSTLSQNNLLCIYENDINKKYPKIFIQYQDYTTDINIMRQHSNRMGFYLGNDIFKLEQIDKYLHKANSTDAGLNICKVIPIEDVYIYTDSNMYKDNDLFVESPIIDNQQLIYDYNRLYLIKSRTQKEQYGNVHLISLKDPLSSVKPTKDFSTEFSKLLTATYGRQLLEFNKKIKSMDIGRNTFMSSPLITGVYNFDKQIDNRTFMVSELGVDASNILVKHGIPPKILDIQKVGAEGGKRNEDVQHIELQDFISGIANSYNNLLQDIATYVVKCNNLDFSGSALYYLKDMDFLTVDGYSKQAVSNSLSGKYLTADELRLLSGFGYSNISASMDNEDLNEKNKLDIEHQKKLSKIPSSESQTSSTEKTSSTSKEANKVIQQQVNKANQNGNNNTSATKKRDN